MTTAMPVANELGLVVPPALLATLPGRVRSVRQLETKAKSTVLRVETDAGVLLAKAGAPAGLRCERAVYQAALPTLGIRAPAVRGWVETDEDVWLVIDFVEGARPVFGDRADLCRVSSWAAGLHLLSRGRDHPPLPPPVGRPAVESRLAALRAATTRWSAGVDSARDACTRIEHALPLVREAAAGIPESLTHGDLSDWNLVLTDDAVIAVDWDQACRRSPAIDLAWLDLAAYGAELRRMGDDTEYRLLARAQAAGVVLACLAHDVARKPPSAQRRYIDRMLGAVVTLREGTGGDGRG